MKTTFDLPDALFEQTKIVAAHSGGARELLTETFSHGQDYGGVTAVNPFL